MRTYELEVDDLNRLANDFVHHPPVCEEQIEKFQRVRDHFRMMAEFLYEHCPRSRELSSALTNLEQANFAANAAIARNETLRDYEGAP